MKILMLSADSTIGKRDVRDSAAPFRDVITSLARGFEELHVVCRTHFHDAIPWQEDNIFVYPSPPLSKVNSLIKTVTVGASIIKTRSIDAISSQDVLRCGIPAVYLRSRFRVPTIIELHGNYLDNPNWVNENLFHRAGNLIGKMVLRQGDLVRVTSEEIRRRVTDMGIEPSKIFFLPHRTDVRRFCPGIDVSDLREELGLGGRRVILFVGRLSWEKNPCDAIEAFVKARRQVPSLHLVMIGEGAERENVDRCIERLSAADSITRLPKIANSDLPRFYNLADTFVLTSRFEGRPRVVQEAMACGVPIVSTRVSGPLEMVRDGVSGFLCEIGDIDGLARALVTINSDNVLQKNMKLAARDFMLHDYTWERGISEMIDMYRRAAHSRSSTVQ